MKITVKGKNIQVTNALKEHVEKKLRRFDDYFEDEVDAIVTLNVERDRHVAEITIPLNGYIIRGEEVTDDMYASIDLVLDKIDRQLRKYKTRLSKKIRSKKLADLSFGVASEEVKEAQADDFRIIKTKTFAIKPMDAEEAIMQMNLLGHNFYVFMNADTDHVNVIYKRHDGNYGLIEPEY